MVINRITAKDGVNVSIHLDNDETLIISGEVVLKFGLRKNDVISDDIYTHLLTENQKYKINHSALNFLGRRIHSAYELKNKLRKKKFDNELIDEVINSLKSSGLLNDQEFADRFTAELILRKKSGINKIKAELIKRGIDRNIISNLLNSLDTGNNQVEQAKEIASKKLATLKKRIDDKNKLKQRIYSFLFSKGYDYDTINTVIGELFNTEE